MTNTTTAPVGLVALDIDGTLLAPGVDHHALPDAKMTDAVNALKDSGVIVALATGRMFPGTLRIAQHLGISQPFICQQGASIHNPDGSLLHHFAIDPDVAKEIAQIAIDEGWPYAWFDAQRYLVSKANPQSQYFADVSGVTPELHPDPRTSGLTATGIDIISTVEHSNGVFRKLHERFGDKVELLDFVSVTAAHSAKANKGLALELLASDLGIARERIVAVGDSVNDVAMLHWAGTGASPAHCDDHARAAADVILEGSGVDGVANLLLKLSEQV